MTETQTPETPNRTPRTCQADSAYFGSEAEGCRVAIECCYQYTAHDCYCHILLVGVSTGPETEGERDRERERDSDEGIGLSLYFVLPSLSRNLSPSLSLSIFLSPSLPPSLLPSF